MSQLLLCFCCLSSAVCVVLGNRPLVLYMKPAMAVRVGLCLLVQLALTSGVLGGLSSLIKCGAGERSIDLGREFITPQPLEMVNFVGGSTSQVVLALTQGGEVYRSSDGGKHWVLINSVLTNAMPSAVSYLLVDVIDAGAKTHIVGISPSLNISHLWTSDSEQNTWTHQNIPFLTHSRVLPSPANPDHLMTIKFAESCHFGAGSSADCFLSLVCSHDGGATWPVIDTYVYDLAWGTQGEIWYTAYMKKSGDYRLQNANPVLIKTKDMGQTLTQVKADAVHVTVASDRIWVFVEPIGKSAELWVSDPSGSDELHRAIFPSVMGAPISDGFEVVKVTKDVIAVNVEHANQGQTGSIDYGNLYISETVPDVAAGGYVFTLSLLNNKRHAGGYHGSDVDFFPLGRLAQFDIANRVDVNPFSQPPNQVTTRTLISFNSGADWRYLQPPGTVDHACDFTKSVGTEQELIPCVSLHLHGTHKPGDGDYVHPDDYSDPYGPLYSHPSAVGLVFGTGSVGYSLMGPYQSYFSRDGGLTWQLVSEGSSVYAFADHGAIVVAADNLRTTHDIRFSLNEGTSAFEHCRFTDSGSFEVVDILAEPLGSSRSVIIHGENNESKGVIVHADFSQVLTRTCEAADFELWHPSTGTGSGCVNGETMQFTRRKPDSECWVASNMQSMATPVPCACARADFSCNFCYELGPDGSSCVPVSTPCDQKTELFNAGVCAAGGLGYYEIGPYRVNPGDKCDQSKGVGPALRPDYVKCPDAPPPESAASSSTPQHHSGGGAGVAIAVVLIVLAVVIGALVALYFKNDTFREKVRSAFSRGPSRNFGGAAFEPLAMDDEDDDLMGGGPDVLDDGEIANQTAGFGLDDEM